MRISPTAMDPIVRFDVLEVQSQKGAGVVGAGDERGIHIRLHKQSGGFIQAVLSIEMAVQLSCAIDSCLEK